MMVPMFREAGIRVIRLGLHYSELLEDAVVAGPFHPAFWRVGGDARVILDMITGIIEEKALQAAPELKSIPGRAPCQKQ